MAQNADCALFEEDAVCKTVDNKLVYGMVTESSEFLSSDDEYNMYEEEEMLSRGKVRIMWHPDGQETVEDEKCITLVDRSLMPGDVIRRLISGKSSQRGYIQDLVVKCHLQVKGTDKYIYNVDARDLKRLKEFEMDDHLSLEPWYGKVITASYECRVVFPDGAECVSDEDDLYDLEFVHGGDDSEYDHDIIPGTQLRGKREDLNITRWVKETKKHHKKMSPKAKINVTVVESWVKSIQMNWICRGFNTSHEIDQLDIPPSHIEKEDITKLKKLSKFQYCSVQMNDLMLYTIKDKNELSLVVPGSVMEQAVNELNIARSGMISDCPIIDTAHASSEPVSSGTGSKMMNADNSIQASSDSASVGTGSKTIDLCNGENDSGVCTNNNGELVNGIDNGNDTDADSNEDMEDTVDISIAEQEDPEYEDEPEQTKEKRKRSQKHSAKGKRKKKIKSPPCEVGDTVPVIVYCTFSIATVMWQDGSVEKDVTSSDLYPVHHLDEHEFFPGDYVVDAKEDDIKPNIYGAIVSSDHQARTCMVNWYKLENGSTIRTSNTADEVSVYDIKDHPEYKFRPGDIVVGVGDPKTTNVGGHAAGQVAGLDRQGGLHIQWPDGSTSFCNPQEVYLIGGDMSEYDSESDDSDTSDSDDSWETEEEEDDSDIENEEPRKWASSTVRKEELENLLDRATAALSKLDDLFRDMPQSMDPTHCFQGIIDIYKQCRKLEKILKSSFYKDDEIVKLIEEARQQLRKLRTERYNRRIEELSKQLKEVSQNLENELTGLMKTMSNTGIQDEQQTSSAGIQNGQQTSNAGIQNEQQTSHDEQETTGTGTNADEQSCSDVNKTHCDSDETNVLTCCDKEKLGIQSSTGLENPRETVMANCDMGVESKEAAENDEIMHNIQPKTQETDKKSQDEKPSANQEEVVTGEKAQAMSNDDKVSRSDTAGSATSDRSSSTETHQLCLKICGMLQERMKRILEEVVPRWMAEGNILVDDNLASRTSLMSVSESLPSPVSITEDMMLNSSQDVTSPMTSSMTSPVPPSPMTPIDVPDIVDEIVACRFIQESESPKGHKMYSTTHTPINLKTFMVTVQKEMRLLQRCLPEGIIVKGYEDRMDLYSAMIIGPKKTPYEDAPFFFDISLPNDYPKSPPVFHYVSFCTDRLNPNLYDDGKVCVSLLGTWEGKDTETWTSNSSLLQVLVSIQGLILVDEPYYNEAGYEKHRGTQQGAENSKMYNEMAILKLVESLTNMIRNIPESFQSECIQHLIKYGPRMLQRFLYWSTNPDPSLKSHPSTSNKDQGLQVSASTGTENKQGDSSQELSQNTELRSISANEDASLSTANQVVPGRTECCSLTSRNEVDPESANEVESSTVAKSLSANEMSCLSEDNVFTVDFPLFPLSRGFCITMNKKLSVLKKVLEDMMENHKHL